MKVYIVLETIIHEDGIEKKSIVEVCSCPQKAEQVKQGLGTENSRHYLDIEEHEVK